MFLWNLDETLTLVIKYFVYFFFIFWARKFQFQIFEMRVNDAENIKFT